MGFTNDSLFVMNNKGEWINYRDIPSFLIIPNYVIKSPPGTYPMDGYCTYVGLKNNGWVLVDIEDYS